jgi:methylated-DNA-[protein]-cysteine S-methyltransferase
MPIRYIDGPAGRLALEAEGDALVGVRWAASGEHSDAEGNSPILREAARQFDRYFKGRLRRFDLAIAERSGTPLQRRIWKAMRRIPFGEAATYGGLAREVGTGARAVGTACARNPLVIVTPCHRVLASGGAIGGYSGNEGLPTKRKLLALEGVSVR